jgi:hypothetical protein
LESLTLATLRNAELGFLGVIVRTAKTTPLLKDEELSLKDLSFALNHFLSAVVLVFLIILFLPFLVN